MVLSGLLAFLLVLTVLRERDDTVRIAVATVDIDGGTTLEAGDVRFAEVSDSDGPLLTAFMNADDIATAVDEGWVATRTIRAGIPLTTTDLRRAASGAGVRVMSVPIAPEHAVNGQIVAGDRIDLISVRRGVAAYVVTNAEVIAVSSSDSTVGGRGFSITIAVDELTSLEVASALDTGGLEIIRSTGAAPADPALTYDPDPSPSTTEAPAPDDAAPSTTAAGG